MLSQQLKWLLQQHFEGVKLDLGRFLKVSLIYFRRKLLFLDLNNIWLIYVLFSEAGVSKKFTFDDFTDCFKKGSNNCYEAFVSAFKPLYLQNMVLSYIGNNYEHCILQLVQKYIYFCVFWGEKQRFVRNLKFLPIFIKMSSEAMLEH